MSEPQPPRKEVSLSEAIAHITDSVQQTNYLEGVARGLRREEREIQEKLAKIEDQLRDARAALNTRADVLRQALDREFSERDAPESKI